MNDDYIDPSGTVSVHGGVTRWAASSARAEQEAQNRTPPDACKAHGGSFRITAGGDVEQLGSARYVMSYDGTPGGSVMATRQRINGATTVELQPGNTASRTLLSTAVAQGLVRETAPGIFEDVRGGSEAFVEGLQAASQEALDGDPGADYFDAHDDALWAQEIADMPQFAYDAASASVQLAAVHGADLQDAAKALAGNTGLELSKAREFVEAGAAIHERAVARAIETVGVTSDQKGDFYSHLRSRPRQLQHALQDLVYRRDPSLFVSLARTWKANRL